MSDINEGTEEIEDEELEEQPEPGGEENPGGEEEEPEGPKRPDWTKQLPKELQADPVKMDELSKSEKIGDLSSSYLEILKKSKELESKVSEIPKRPEKPEDYDFKLPEGYEVDENLVNHFKEWCHESDLSQEQAASIFDKYNNELVNMNERVRRMGEEAKEETNKLFHGKWGKNYDLNMELIRRGMIQFGGPEFKRFMDTSGLGNHPQMIDFMLNVSRAIAEGVFIEGEKEPGHIPYQAPEKEKPLFPSMEGGEVNRDSKVFVDLEKQKSLKLENL